MIKKPNAWDLVNEGSSEHFTCIQNCIICISDHPLQVSPLCGCYMFQVSSFVLAHPFCLFLVSDISGSIRNFCHTQNSGTKHKFEMEQIQPKKFFSVRKRGVKRAKGKKKRNCHLRRRDPLYWGERWARRKGKEGKKCLITISECERRGMRVETTRLSNFSHFSFFFFFLPKQMLSHSPLPMPSINYLGRKQRSAPIHK